MSNLSDECVNPKCDLDLPAAWCLVVVSGKTKHELTGRYCTECRLHYGVRDLMEDEPVIFRQIARLRLSQGLEALPPTRVRLRWRLAGGFKLLPGWEHLLQREDCA